MRFSIIIPAYNAEKYINYCLESVVRQDYPKDDYEVIVIDDCSPDRQDEVIERYTSNYPPLSSSCDLSCESTNVRLLKHESNKRQGGARNTGVAAARGEWIIFLDADDYWCRNDVLKTFSSLIDKYPNSLIIESICHVDVTDWNSNLDGQMTEYKDVKSYNGIDYIIKSQHYSSYVWRSVYRKRHIEGKQFRENVFFEDSDWRLNVVMTADEIVEVYFPFYAYVNNPTSTIRGKNIDVFYANVESNLLLFEMYSTSPNEALKAFGMNRIKSNILSWLKISKDYTINESSAVLKYATTTRLFDLDTYSKTTIENCMLHTIKIFPTMSVAMIKFSVLFRRKLRKLYNRKNSQ